MICHAFEGPAFLAREGGPARFEAYRELSLVRVDHGELAAVGPGFSFALYVPEFLHARPQPLRDESERLHSGLRAVGGCLEVDACLSALETEEGRLRAHGHGR